RWHAAGPGCKESGRSRQIRKDNCKWWNRELGRYCEGQKRRLQLCHTWQGYVRRQGKHRESEGAGMTLAKRIIPCLDVDNGRVVKGVNFAEVKDAGDPVELAEKYSEQGADELVLLDITASQQGRETMKGVVRNVASVIDIPFTVGGGIKKLEDAREILLSGADKVSINTDAVKNSELITQLMSIFGKQCIVVAIDEKRIYKVEKGRTIFKEQVK